MERISIKFYFLIIPFFFLLLISNNYSQSSETQLFPRYGLLFNFNFNRLETDLRQSESIPDTVPVISGNDDIGYSFGLFYEIPFNTKLLLYLRGMYTYQKAEISKDYSTQISYNSNPVNSKIQHLIPLDLSRIIVEPLLKFKFYENFSIMGGVSAGYRLSNKFNHSESILEPANIKFPDSTRSHQVDTEFEQSNSLSFAITGGLGFEIPLNIMKTFLIEGEILYSAGYADVAKNFTTDLNSIRFGISIKYSPTPKSNEEIEKIQDDTLVIQDKPILVIPEPIKPDTIPTFTEIKPIEVKPFLNVQGIDDAADQITNVKIEEFLSTDLKPLLNYIFFDYNSSDIPKKYIMLSKEEVLQFNPNKLFNNTTLETYYQLLNIIGRRLKDKPKARITLTGCNSDIGDEAGNQELSGNRAIKIKDYLTNTWDIKPERITVIVRNLPLVPSNNQDPDGQSDNRRVEITGTDESIFDPVITEDTLKKAYPSVIIFNPKVIPDTGYKSWKIVITKNEKIIKMFSGEGKLPPSVDWDLRELQHSGTDKSGNLMCSLELIPLDRFYISEKAINNIKLSSITIKDKDKYKEDSRIDNFSLILFQFDRSAPEEKHKKIIGLISNYITGNSEVFVKGYTDRIGDEEYNLILSEDRARNVAALLKPAKVNYSGLGKSKEIYDNSLPEGRFYSRTVKIEVITKTKK